MPSLLRRLLLRLQGVRLHWDRYPQDGTHLRPFTNVVAMRGWAVAADGIRSVEIFCDGKRLGSAVLGLRRRDVFCLFPHLRNSRRAGFQYLLDTKKLANGCHQLTILARSRWGRSAKISTPVFIQNLSTSYDWFSRQTRPGQADLAWMRRNALHLPHQPKVSLGIAMQGEDELSGLVQTIASLRDQAYANWELIVCCAAQWKERVNEYVNETVGSDSRCRVAAGSDPAWQTQRIGEWFGLLHPGDQLAPDALFEMVYQSNLHPTADFLYADVTMQRLRATEARTFQTNHPARRQVLAVEHIGWPWLVRTDLLERCNDANSEASLLQDLLDQSSHAEPIGKILGTRPGASDPEIRIRELIQDEQPTILSHSPYPLLDLESIRSILVVKLDHVGDVLVTVPAMRRLRELFPEARITAVVGSWARPLVEHEPGIDEVLTYDFFAASSARGGRDLTDQDARAFRGLLEGRTFDLAIDLRRESDTRPFLRWSGATYTVGYANRHECDWLSLAIPWDDVRPVQPPRRHVALDALRLVEMVSHAANADLCPGVPISGQDKEKADWILSQRLPANVQLLVGLHPGAGRPIKCWPAERFAHLADRMIEQLGATVILFGTAEDERAVNRFLHQVRRSDRVVSLVSELSLSHFMAILERLDFFVGNDSGPTHLAAAAGIPTLGVYAGTIDAAQWAPLGPKAAVIQKKMRCSPCFLAKKPDCPYDIACLGDLSVNDVWAAAVRVLLPKWQQIGLDRVLGACDRLSASVF
jgi:lipopolysaccharide heptosyltransferase II